MLTNYQEVIKEAIQEKQIAELRLQAANLNHSAACMEQNQDMEIKIRSEIHALTDIILDNSAIVFHCFREIAGKT